MVTRAARCALYLPDAEILRGTCPAGSVRQEFHATTLTGTQHDPADLLGLRLSRPNLGRFNGVSR